MLIHGDCLEKLKTLPDNSVDSVVTDPPYGLSFMNKHWDYDVPSVEVWREVLRVLKPGGHLLSFGGTRTYHRMVVNIEDAGFEIRDQIQWIYGSGFPKSLNLKGEKSGIGTALKPANEPIVLARKPLIGTVAENVEKFGTGGLNIDGCRIAHSETIKAGKSPKTPQEGWDRPWRHNPDAVEALAKRKEENAIKSTQLGRWPANVILDEVAAELLDQQSGELKSGAHNGFMGALGYQGGVPQHSVRQADSGGASRFFYVAKASKRERNAGLDQFYCSNVELDACAESTEQVTSILKGISESIPNSSIDLSGAHIMATFPRECISTIRTAIQQTIESKTSNSSTPLHTKENMKAVDLNQTDGTSHVLSAKSSKELTTLIGTLLDKAGLATADAEHVTLRKLSKLSAQDAWRPVSNGHPTIKPIRLMQYLIKLVTPPNGTVLDPFMGSGSTGCAARSLGFKFIGIEREKEYVEIASRRIEAAC